MRDNARATVEGRHRAVNGLEVERLLRECATGMVFPKGYVLKSTSFSNSTYGARSNEVTKSRSLKNLALYSMNNMALFLERGVKVLILNSAD